MTLPATTARTAQDTTAILSWDRFGNPSIPHEITTDRGTVRLVSSWPDGEIAAARGLDLRVAVDLAIELAGGAAGGFALVHDHRTSGTDAYPDVFDAEVETSNASDAFADGETAAFLGGWSSAAVERALLALDGQGQPLLAVGLGTTWPGLTRTVPGMDEAEPERLYPDGVRDFARAALPDDSQGRAAAGWAATAGRRAAYVFHDGNPYGRTTSAAFAAAFAAAGGTVAGTHTLPPDPPSFARFVDDVVASGADCVYLGAVGTVPMGRFLAALRASLSIDRLTILGPDGLDDPSVTFTLVQANDDAFVTTGPVRPADLAGDPIGAEWLAAMRERIGQGRDPDPIAIAAFEVTVALIQAIDVTGDGDYGAIREAMFATRDCRGLLGAFAVDVAGDRVPALVRFARLDAAAFVTAGIRTDETPATVQSIPVVT